MFKLSSASSYCKWLALAGWGDLLAHSRKETSIDQITWFMRLYVSCAKNNFSWIGDMFVKRSESLMLLPGSSLFY